MRESGGSFFRPSLFPSSSGASCGRRHPSATRCRKRRSRSPILWRKAKTGRDPKFPGTDPHQAVVCGEFGGLGLPLEGHTLLDKGNWGYRSYDSKEALTKAYLEKIEMLKPMIQTGLAAAIYTQIFDVEIEVNGLLTYDREVSKMDADVIRKANNELYEVTP